VSNDEMRETTLREGALKLPSVMMQGITHIAPAVGLILSIQFITSLAGVTSPLAYALAFLIVVTLGISLTQLARHLPSAGGYFTYVSRTVHPRAGFLGMLLGAMKRAGREAWLLKAGHVAYEKQGGAVHPGAVTPGG
jgi:amino acid transporter